MSASIIDQLNLTPQERRIVVGIALVVFVVLNVLLVFPHFSDLRRVRAQLEETRGTIRKWNVEILKDQDKNGGYQVQLHELQKQQGGGIGNQQVALQRTVNEHAGKTGVNISETRPANLMNAESNAFYEEQAVRITFEGVEDQLVNFLYNVGNDPAMIRVREINLKTADNNRYRLRGDAILSANYAKQPPAAPAKAAAPPPKGLPPAAPASRGPALPGPGKPPPALNRPPAMKPVPAPGAIPGRKNL